MNSHSNAKRPSHLIGAVSVLVTGALFLSVSPAAADAGQQLTPVPFANAVPEEQWKKLPESITNAREPVAVFVQTTGEGALTVQHNQEQQGFSPDQAEDSAKDTAAANEQVTDEVTEALLDTDSNAEVLYSAAYSVPGFAATAEPDALIELALRADVVKITPITPQELVLPKATADPTNASSDALSRAVDAWQQTGNTGKNVTVAVVDTGVDYTHATFGGPGTTDAYRSALASTQAPEAAWFDAKKYVGGWDFAGTTYNGSQGTLAYDPVPRPDANPIDGRGGNHGTHVAGTAVGYGVTLDGQTFDDDYAGVAAEGLGERFSVGPGAAPEAKLLALKVFGDGGGSTALTGAALEWIAEQIATGSQIDVVNLSLGTDFGAVDDPDGAKLATLMDAGVLPVVAAGNAGDISSISGSPGNSGRVLTVAASASGNGLGDAVYGHFGDPNATEPQQALAQYSQNYSGTFDLLERVVTPGSSTNLNGCAPFSTEDAADIRGHIVWLQWSDGDIACGSVTRFDNAQAAGAAGVLLESQADGFEIGIGGNTDIPGAQLSASGVSSYRPALEAGTLFVRLTSDGRGLIPYSQPGRVDTLASFSSRGVHGSVDLTLKPDVAAPGVNVTSAGNGTGTGRATMSGTSMATPHVAGIAALVKQAHPDWTPDRIKQQIMNTAIHDVTTGGATPTTYGPARAGTGRVDALAATQSLTTIQSLENGTGISAAFGVIEVGAEQLVQTRDLRITNGDTVARNLALAYEARTRTPGVEYSLSQSSVTVPAGGSADVTLTVRIDDPAALRRTLDPTMSRDQGGLPRQFFSDASGVVTATASDGRSPIRLSVHAAPKPVSATEVAGIHFTGNAGEMILTGRGLAQGEGSESYTSMMVPLVLGTEDPDDTFPVKSAVHALESVDLLAVGASSTSPLFEDPSRGLLTVGIVTDGDWASLNPLSYPMVELDVNGDNRSDFAIILQQADRSVDQFMAYTVDLVTGATVDQRPVNGLYGDRGTNPFDTNVMTMSTSLRALGYTTATTKTQLRYIVQTRSYFAPAYDSTYRGTLVDETEPVTFDVYNPPMSFGSSTTPAAMFTDAQGALAVTRTEETQARALVLHLHGGNGQRASIVTPTIDAPEAPNPGGGPNPGGEPRPGDGPTFPTAPETPRGGGHTVAARDGDLAYTGATGELFLGIAVAAGLIVAGLAALQIRRRRSRNPSPGL